MYSFSTVLNSRRKPQRRVKVAKTRKETSSESPDAARILNSAGPTATGRGEPGISQMKATAEAIITDSPPSVSQTVPLPTAKVRELDQPLDLEQATSLEPAAISNTISLITDSMTAPPHTFEPISHSSLHYSPGSSMVFTASQATISAGAHSDEVSSSETLGPESSQGQKAPDVASNQRNHKSDKEGIIIGSILGGVFALIFCAILLVCAFNRKRWARTRKEKTITTNVPGDSDLKTDRSTLDTRLSGTTLVYGPEDSAEEVEPPTKFDSSPFDSKDLLRINRLVSPPPIPPMNERRLSRGLYQYRPRPEIMPARPAPPPPRASLPQNPPDRSSSLPKPAPDRLTPDTSHQERFSQRASTINSRIDIRPVKYQVLYQHLINPGARLQEPHIASPGTHSFRSCSTPSCVSPPERRLTRLPLHLQIPMPNLHPMDLQPPHLRQINDDLPATPMPSKPCDQRQSISASTPRLTGCTSEVRPARYSTPGAFIVKKDTKKALKSLSTDKEVAESIDASAKEKPAASVPAPNSVIGEEVTISRHNSYASKLSKQRPETMKSTSSSVYSSWQEQSLETQGRQSPPPLGEINQPACEPIPEFDPVQHEGLSRSTPSTQVPLSQRELDTYGQGETEIADLSKGVKLPILRKAPETKGHETTERPKGVIQVSACGVGDSVETVESVLNTSHDSISKGHSITDLISEIKIDQNMNSLAAPRPNGTSQNTDKAARVMPLDIRNEKAFNCSKMSSKYHDAIQKGTTDFDFENVAQPVVSTSDRSRTGSFFSDLESSPLVKKVISEEAKHTYSGDNVLDKKVSEATTSEIASSTNSNRSQLERQKARNSRDSYESFIFEFQRNGNSLWPN